MHSSPATARSLATQPAAFGMPRALLPALALCGVCLAALLLVLLPSSDQLAHWFVLPVIACGLVTGTTAVLWVARGGDFLDVRGLMALLALYVFCLAPLLQVWCGFWHPYLPPLADRRDWIGLLAMLNLASLGLWWTLAFRRREPIVLRSTWVIDRPRLLLVAGVAMAACAVIQTGVYAKFGGIGGYVRAFDESVDNPSNSFLGMGWLFAFSESFPVLLVMLAVVWFRDRQRTAPLWLAGGILLAFAVTQVYFGGLRGCRSNTVFAGFWCLGMVHLYIRRFSPRLILGTLLPLFLAFSFLYGTYKWGGVEGVKDALRGVRSTDTQRIRGWEHLAFIDLARTEVQSMVLQRTVSNSSDYDYAWGRTYYSGLVAVVPSALWPGDRPDTKRREGTLAIWGKNSYTDDEKIASYMYGLGGEAMLNFGPLGVPLAFAALGLLVSYLVAFHRGLDHDDARWLIVPLLVLGCVLVLMEDCDNVARFFVRHSILPAIVLTISCRFVRR